MSHLTGLFQRGSSYYLRIVLPKSHPLKHLYRNGCLVQTLGTCSHREAVNKGTLKRAEVLCGFQPTVEQSPTSSATAQSCGLAAITAIPGTTQAKSPELLTLQMVHNRWKVSKKRSEDSVSACLRAVTLFEEFLGKKVDLRTLTRAQGDSFRAWLLTKVATSKTSKDRFTWVKSLLKYAAQDLEAIPRSPWEGLDIAHRTTARRRPWSPDELSTLFGQPLFTRYELPRDSKAGRDAAYWIPLIGLFTGARISELAQLRPEDVITTATGPMLSITDESPGQQVKSDAGIRSIPIHPELVRLGFLDYVHFPMICRAIPANNEQLLPIVIAHELAAFNDTAHSVVIIGVAKTDMNRLGESDV